MNTIDKMYDNYTSGEKKVDELHHRIAVQLNIPDFGNVDAVLYLRYSR